MNKPKVIMVNAVSLDGSFIGFKVDMRLFMELTSEYRSAMIMEGSESLVTGLTEMCKGNIPPEEESDFVKPEMKPGEPYFVVPDSRAITRGLLHMSRRMTRQMGLGNDVMVLVSKKTDPSFISYLEERQFSYHICGEEKVDFHKAFDLLLNTYGADIVRIDAGPTLNGLLLKQGLLDEIILQVYPVLVGNTSDKLLNQLINAVEGINLELIKGYEAGKGTLFLHYRVIKPEEQL